MKKQYYIEFVGEDGEYVLQSKWFNTKALAVKWLDTNIDYIDTFVLQVYLMVANYNEDGSYDIEQVKRLRD